ncbi:MAG: AMP-binding protein [Lentimicrobiaceae bacterium]|nr:AMP-binding protein [Lentimicrobiaceae bacterium]
MKTIIDLFEESVSQFGDNFYLYEDSGNGYQGFTYKEVKETVYKTAAGLISLGINPGDRVAILSEGRNAWIISELAVLYAGACCVPLSVKLDAATDLKFRLLHSGCRMVVVSAQQAAKIEEIRQQLPELETVIYLDKKPENQQNDYTYSELTELGDTFLLTQKDALVQRFTAVRPDDLANISYTSGTTADPKGIMLTHLNYTGNVKQALTLMEIPSTHRTLAILPWDHSFAHTACLYCFMAKGAGVGSVKAGKTVLETLKNVPQSIQELKPNLMMSVPALSRNFRKNIETGIEKKGRLLKAVFDHAIAVSYLYNGLGFNRGKGFRFLLQPLVKLYDQVFFKKIRQAFGGKMEFFIGGGALLDIELQRFFLAIGIPVFQGYGLSEASPVISSNSAKYLKLGTSGKLVGFLELKILDGDGRELPQGETGEIVIKGDNVMKGYWKNPKATDEVLRDGWLFTGDLGYMDEDGYLVVLGRFKSLLIANDGEKYSPEGIEEAIMDQSPFISQCMLYNNQHSYTVGLIVPDIASVNRELLHKGIEPGSDEGIEAALKLIDHEVDAYFKGGRHAGQFPERWLPSAICILPEGFTEHNHFMNSTLKIVRAKITDHYASELDFLYTPQAKNTSNDLNRKNLARWYA